MKKTYIFLTLVAILVTGCIPGTRDARIYQDKMLGNTIIESGDTRVGTDTIGQNIYVGYIAHIDSEQNIISLKMEVTYNASNWLFYNECWIKIDNNDIIKKTRINIEREIIGSYNLMERGSFPIKEETLLLISKSSSGLIRVIGSKGYTEVEINQSLREQAGAFAKKINLTK